MITRLVRTCAGAFFLPLACVITASAQGAPRYDLLVKNGTVLDGSGSPGFAADVGVTGNRIVRVSRSAIDAREAIF